MITSIAEYYINELDDSQTAIEFYLEETDELGELLKQGLRSATLPHVAAKTGNHLHQLFLSQQNLLLQKDKNRLLKQKLLLDHKPIENELVTYAVQQEIREIRKALRSMEKDYLDTRYDCHEFIADMIVLRYKHRFAWKMTFDNYLKNI